MKKVFSLLLVVAMLASLSLVAFAAEPNAAGGMHTVITETDEGITVTVYANKVNKLNSFTFNLQSSAITYAGDLKVNAAFDTKLADPSATSMKVNYSSTSAATYITADSVEILSFKATKVDADATLTEADFAYGTKINNLSKLTTASNTDTIAGVAAGPSNFASNKSAYQQYFTLEYVDARTPAVEEDKFINDEGATGGVATLTFYGRVGADWLDQDYGVIVEGKDFYGAKNGDIISDGAEGTKTFDFDAWDGNFEIILTNITVKGTAGEKTYQFFVGENLTEEATVVVE